MSANALEREIIEKFRQLDAAAKERVLQQLVIKEQPKQSFDYEAWLHRINAVSVKLNPDENGYTPTVQELLDEVREED